MGQLSPTAQGSGAADDVERAKQGSRRWSVRSKIAIVIPLVALLVALGLTTVARRQPDPLATVGPAASGVGPAANGLIAYSSDGDIFVGNPVTGASQAITSGPESDINPKFSPDGTRIAFVRGTPGRGPASLIVVRTDGSDERVVVPEGFSGPGPEQVGPFAWTPGGGALVVQSDFPPNTAPYGDGELGLFDASGVREPQLLVPPLTAWPGAIYFNPSAQVAPMFRPPDGDLIVDGCGGPLGPTCGQLRVFDADLTLVRQLGGEALADWGWQAAFDPTWSPDAAWILVFGLETSLINAEGGDARSLGPARSPAWSPDRSSIAYEDIGPGWDIEDPPAEVRIAMYDLASGTRRVLESSVSPVKEGATVQTITWNTAHTWYFEGWSWSPDGGSLLLLKDHRTRPIVVDVATDTASELPWETDSFPSWQRVSAPLGVGRVPQPRRHASGRGMVPHRSSGTCDSVNTTRCCSLCLHGTTRCCGCVVVPHTGFPVKRLMRLSHVHRVPPRDA